MKTFPTMQRKPGEGFTLLELVVVVSMLAVLAVAGFKIGISLMERARKTAALEAITSLETAIASFYTDHGTLPVPNMSTDDTRKTDDVALLQALLGTEQATPALNTRSTRYLRIPEGKEVPMPGKDGLVYAGGGSRLKGLYDPWGGLYKIRFDGDMNGQISPVKTDAEPRSTVLSGKTCAIWSNGRDGVNGGGKASDDVKSWK